MPVINNHLLRHAKRWIIIVIGFSVLLLGIALIFLPGPAILVIPLGLAILGTELLWARRLWKRIKGQKEEEEESRKAGEEESRKEV